MGAMRKVLLMAFDCIPYNLLDAKSHDCSF